MTFAEQRDERFGTRLYGLHRILNGSVIANAPLSELPHAKTTYTQTRILRGKTVTVAISEVQYEALARAIEAYRKLEPTLQLIRDVSAKTLLDLLAGLQRKPRKNGSSEKASPFGSRPRVQYTSSLVSRS